MNFINCDPSNPLFKEVQDKGQKLALALNALPIEEITKRMELVKELFQEVGQEVKVYSPLRVDLGKNITVGDYSLINQNCTLLDTGPIQIGKRVLIGPDVKIYTATHSLYYQMRYAKQADNSYIIQTTAKAVIIGDDVWIGGGSIILPGVKIGNRVVIGAGSVVTKDIPDDVIVVGNPARIFKSTKE